MRYSDLIVPHGVQNDIALQFISENLKNKLLSRGILVRDPKATALQNFRIMFEVVDDVLISYGNVANQIYSIKDKAKDLGIQIDNELEHLKVQLSRFIIESESEDSRVIKSYFDNFGDMLIKTFTHFNPNWNLNEQKKQLNGHCNGEKVWSYAQKSAVKRYLFLNKKEAGWNKDLNC